MGRMRPGTSICRLSASSLAASCSSRYNSALSLLENSFVCTKKSLEVIVNAIGVGEEREGGEGGRGGEVP